jgi:CBS domain-containing protein
MEIVGLFFLGSMFLIALMISLLATVNTTWPGEEEGDYFRHNQHRAQTADPWRKSSVTKDAAESAGGLAAVPTNWATALETVKAKFRAGEAFEPPAPREEPVSRLMKSTPYYCFEFQPLRVARIIMRENHLQSLPVVDFGRRVVGTITTRDIAAFQQKLAK